LQKYDAKGSLIASNFANRKGQSLLKTGYARVSTLDQNLELQLRTLKKAGCQKIFREKASGASRQRPEFQRMLDQIRPGDIIVVWKLDRLARSTRDLLNTMETISEAGAKFESLSEPWANTTTHVGKMDHDSLRPASRNLRGI
jgi:DNA invertase Pin-like site-specific DNA recombinase